MDGFARGGPPGHRRFGGRRSIGAGHAGCQRRQIGTVALPAERVLVYSSVRATGGADPHAYGVTIELFKHDGVWTGFLSQYVGPPADPPSANLDDLRVDERRSQVTFATILTIGAVAGPGAGSWRPDRRRYEFEGSLAADRITGTLTTRPEGGAPSGSTRDAITLMREVSPSDVSYDAWQARWRARLGRGAAAPRSRRH